MAKYINADEFVTNLDTMRNPDSKFATDDYIDGFSDGISAAIKELEAFPTADVAPVKHGHWIFGATNGHSWQKCSECCVLQQGQTLCFSYCPNCGSRMVGETI